MSQQNRLEGTSRYLAVSERTVLPPGDGDEREWTGRLEPHALVVDSHGHAFVSDTANGCIRKVSRDGAVQIFAGREEHREWTDEASLVPGEVEMAGFAIGPDGALYFSDRRHHRVCKVVSPDGDYEVVAEEGLQHPVGLAFDAEGRLYIGDTGNRRIARLAPGGKPTTWWQPSYPCEQRLTHLAVEADGSVLAGIWYEIRRLPAGEPIGSRSVRDAHSRLEGLSRAFAPLLFGIGSVALDEEGTRFAVDLGSRRVVRLGADGLQVVTLRHYDDDERFAMLQPRGCLFILDEQGWYRRLTPSGEIGDRFEAELVPAAGRSLGPELLAFDPEGRVYLMLPEQGRIDIVEPDGTRRCVFALRHEAAVDGHGQVARFYCPMAIAIDAEDTLYVAEPFRQRIRRISPQGEVTTLIQGFPEATEVAYSAGPAGLTVGRDGALYALFVADGRILRIDAQGRAASIAKSETLYNVYGNPEEAPFLFGTWSFVQLADGRFAVADRARRGLRVVDPKTGTWHFQTFKEAPFEFGRNNLYQGPATVALDADERLLVGMRNRIGYWQPDGSLSNIVAKPDFRWPGPWAVGSDGALTVLSERCASIQRYEVKACEAAGDVASEAEIVLDPPVAMRPLVAWTVGTPVGGLRAGASEGPAASDVLCAPQGVAEDPLGRLWISDAGNMRVCLVTDEQVRSLADGNGGMVQRGGAVLVGGDGRTYMVRGYGDEIWEVTSDGVSRPLELFQRADLRYREGRLAISTYEGTTIEVTSQEVDGYDLLEDRIREAGEDGRCYWPVLAIEPDGTAWIDPLNELVQHPRRLARVHLASQQFEANLPRPLGRSVILDGSLYLLSDTAVWRIRDGIQELVAGGQSGCSDGPGRAAKFRRLTALVADSAGYLYVADRDNHRIRMISPTFDVVTLAGGERGFREGAAAQAQFNLPVGLALTAQGDLLVADSGNHAIRVISRMLVRRVVEEAPPRQLHHPSELVGRRIRAVSRTTHAISLYFDDAWAMVVLDDENGIIELAKPGAEAYSDEGQVSQFDMIGCTVEEVRVTRRASRGLPFPSRLRLSSGLEIRFDRDVGRPMLLPVEATPYRLETSRYDDPWDVLVDRRVESVVRTRRHVELCLGSDRLRLERGLRLERTPYAGWEEPLPTRRGYWKQFAGAVVTCSELVYSKPGGLPTRVTLTLDIGGDMTLWHPEGRGIVTA